jgi:hypothetical protein
MKRLDEFQLKLQGLHIEKSHRLQKVTYQVNTIRDISTVLASISSSSLLKFIQAYLIQGIVSQKTSAMTPLPG